MIARYTDKVRWIRDGMDWPMLNCWGLVRLARHELYGLPLLQRFDGLQADDKRSVTKACAELGESCISPISKPAEGAIATVWRGKLCMHVALVIRVDGRLAILEADQGIDCRWMWLQDWERMQTRVIYYHDRQD